MKEYVINQNLGAQGEQLPLSLGERKKSRAILENFVKIATPKY